MKLNHPEVVSGTETPPINVVEIVNAARNVEREGFDYLNETDIEEMMSFTDDMELKLEKLEENVATINTGPVSEDDRPNIAKSDSTSKGLKELFSLADQLCNWVVDLGPIMERKLMFKIYYSTTYKELRKEAKKKEKAQFYIPILLSVIIYILSLHFIKKNQSH